MRKKITIFLILIFVLGLAPINFSNAQDLSDKLSGKILLQVESVGQAWYIDPETKERAFLGRPADAFRIMRELGLGISEDSYNSFNGYAPSRLSGKILLRVEANGEAYYVFPDDLRLYYLGRPADAFNIMRNKGLGITDADLEKVPVFEKYAEQVGVNTETIDANTQALLDMQKQLDDQQQLIKDLQAKQEQEKIELGLSSLANQEIINKVKPAVVYVSVNSGSGTGMILDSTGNILTNAHVVEGFNSATIKLADNRVFSANVIGRDEYVDLAILKINSTNLPYVEFGNSDTTNQGDEVYTLGYPFGIEGDVSFKEGTVSRKLTDSGYEYIETSADIHPGNSGGPLVNQYGFVVGVNTFTIGKTVSGIQVGETIKFSISINTAKLYIDLLKAGRNEEKPKIVLPDIAGSTPLPTPTPTPTPTPEPEPKTVIDVKIIPNGSIEFNVYNANKPGVPLFINSVVLKQTGTINDSDFEYIFYNELNNQWKNVLINNNNITINNPGLGGRILINPKIKESGLGKTLIFEVIDINIKLEEGEEQGTVTGLNQSDKYLQYPTEFLDFRNTDGGSYESPLDLYCKSIGMGFFYEWFNDSVCVSL